MFNVYIYIYIYIYIWRLESQRNIRFSENTDFTADYSFELPSHSLQECEDFDENVEDNFPESSWINSEYEVF